MTNRMFTIPTIIVLIIIGLGALLWQSNARAREFANKVSQQACKRHDLQFLDGTIILQKLRVKRANSGRLAMMRFYQFDFYDGKQRLTGRITVFNHEVIELFLESPDKPADSDKSLFKSANEVSGNVIEFPKKKD